MLSPRLATLDDVASLTGLLQLSVRALQAGDYTPEQIEVSLRTVYGIDTQLIYDATYYVIEEEGATVGCGGWSRRNTLFGGDQLNSRDDSLLDPATDAARIRAFFVHPQWARRGVGAMLLTHCEQAAAHHGFRRLELGATVTGVPFYRRYGYTELARLEVPLEPGLTMPIIQMEKRLP